MSLSRSRAHKLLIILIVAIAAFMRLQGLNWDSGFHFHPDERMLIMVTEKIEFFSQLNPDFFNYGSLPIYILAGAAQILDTLFKTHVDSYDGLLLLGRMISTCADLGVTFFIFLIAELVLKDKKAALWSMFMYAVAFFPIQNSHFFIVDTFLNLFATILVYVILKYRTEQRPRFKYVFLMGIVYAACLTTKVTSLIFAPVIFLALALPLEDHEHFFQRMWNALKNRTWFHKKRIFDVSHLMMRIIIRLSIFTLILLIFAFLFMPYAFVSSAQFLREILLQVQMNSNPYIFPYTLQYVGTTPYLYYLKNIFLWGLGPVISVFALIGILIVIFQGIRQIISYKLQATNYQLLFALFYFIFFLVIGKSAVKFMRYMLLMYPFFAIMAGYAISHILHVYRDRSDNQQSTTSFLGSKYLIVSFHILVYIILPILWTVMFLNIYSTPSTRIQATSWINNHIPQGSTLAVEHWDDRVPIFDPGNYQYEEMTLYDVPDNDVKWSILNQKLARTDYIIIASNRLYTPLQRLQKCDEHGRCYPMTKKYYEQLFSGELGFQKVAEFTSYPRLELGHWKLEINDSSSDESFTVYDHPKIMIFGRK